MSVEQIADDAIKNAVGYVPRNVDECFLQAEYKVWRGAIQQAIQQAVAEERERCGKVANRCGNHPIHAGQHQMATYIARLIRNPEQGASDE